MNGRSLGTRLTSTRFSPFSAPWTNEVTKGICIQVQRCSKPTHESELQNGNLAYMLDLLLTLLSAMSISPVRNSMNSSRAASSPSDLDARKVSWVSASGKSCFLELNRHRAAVLVLRPLEPGVCQLGDLTFRIQ